MTDIVKAIQRIAKTPELKKAIEDLLNGGNIADYGSIGQGTFTAYQNADGSISGGNPAADSSGVDGFSDNLADALDELGIDIADNLDDLFGDLSDEFDLQDIVDNGLNVGDQIDKLNGLYDCNDLGGNEAQIIVGGDFYPPDADMWIGETGDYNPSEDIWRSGVWYTTGSPAVNGATPWACGLAYMADRDAASPSSAPYILQSIDAIDPDTATDGDGFLGHATRTDPVDSNFPFTILIRKTGCTVGVDAHCPNEAPDSEWQADDVHQLKFDGALFETSPFENAGDQILDFTNSPSKLTGCSSGGDPVTIQPTSDGGLAITTGTDSNYITDSTGEVTGLVSDALLSGFLPG